MPRRKAETVEHPAHHRSPGIAALLNFIIWGTGYIYNAKRIEFGVGLILVMILTHAVLLLSHGFGWFLASPGIWLVFTHMILSLLLAYDAYKDGKLA